MNLNQIGGAFQAVVVWFPFAHALDAIRSFLLHGAGGRDIAKDLVWVVVHTAVATIAAIAVFRGRMVE